MSFPVFDLHCDTALSLLGRDLSGGISLRENHGHIDLHRAAALPGYAQCFALFTTPQMSSWYSSTPVLEIFERELAFLSYQLEQNREQIRLAYSSEDVRENEKQGIMTALLTLEGTAGFGFDPSLLEDLYKIGFRITSLGWNEQNVLTGSHMTGGGLTDLGREYLKEAQRVGMIVDVSHISDEGFWDIIGMTEKPIVATHSNSRAVCNVSRNLTDEMFLAICQTGGVAGLNQCADFVGEKPDLNTACDHVFHFLDLDPEGDHIALGGDLDGCDRLTDGFDGVQDYPKLAAKLLERGAGERIVRKIFWENPLGVMDKCCM